MWKACARCGKIHDYNKKCYVGYNHKKKDTNANKFRNTIEWTNKAIEIKEDSKYLCSICLANNIFNYNKLEVHHIEPINENYNRRLDNYNLICLCKLHHIQAERNEIKREYLFKLAQEREDKLTPPI